uniref:Uncharacterized protein n=1 Tax=Amphimedon queenslandica TaxID=400682 RepID=A0A1X7UF55_AMPQE
MLRLLGVFFGLPLLWKSVGIFSSEQPSPCLLLIPHRVVDQTTPLHDATRSGSEIMVTALVNNKANLNAKDWMLDKTLPPVVSGDKTKLRRGAHDEGTPLHYAARSGSETIVTILVKNGADVNAKNKVQETPLHYAAGSGSETIVTILVKNGADVNAMDKVQKTPLHYAARSGSETIVTILVKNGADVNAMDKVRTLVMFCFFENMSEALAFK